TTLFRSRGGRGEALRGQRQGGAVSRGRIAGAVGRLELQGSWGAARAGPAVAQRQRLVGQEGERQRPLGPKGTERRAQLEGGAEAERRILLQAAIQDREELGGRVVAVDGGRRIRRDARAHRGHRLSVEGRAA